MMVDDQNNTLKGQCHTDRTIYYKIGRHCLQYVQYFKQLNDFL